jgi:hypothetical protein
MGCDPFGVGSALRPFSECRPPDCRGTGRLPLDTSLEPLLLCGDPLPVPLRVHPGLGSVLRRALELAVEAVELVVGRRQISDFNDSSVRKVPDDPALRPCPQIEKSRLINRVVVR